MRPRSLVSPNYCLSCLLAEATRTTEPCPDADDIKADYDKANISTTNGLANSPFKPMEHTLPVQEPSPPELFSRAGEITVVAKTQNISYPRRDLPIVIVSLEDWQ